MVVEEQEGKGEGQQSVVIRQEQEEMWKLAEAQAPPLPLPAPAPPPQQEHAQEQQQQSESPPPPQHQQQQQQLTVKAPPTPWRPPTLQDLPAGLGALNARSDPFGTWCGVRDDEERAQGRGSEEKNGNRIWLQGQHLRELGEGTGSPTPNTTKARAGSREKNRHLPASIMLDTGTYFI